MTEFIENIEHWSKKNSRIALARVIKTWGSAPRPVGSIMLINEEGEMTGSVSGGCVEGAVVKSSGPVIQDQNSTKLSYGVSDEEAWTVGLACGGSIQVFLQPISMDKDAVWVNLKESLEQNISSVLVSSLEEGRNKNTLFMDDGSVIGDEMPKEVVAQANESHNKRINQTNG